MSVLGLDSRPEQEENIFKRILWPRDEPYEADSLGQQGFWVCLIVGVLSALVSCFTGHPFVGLLMFLLYWLGGMGVREHSIAAAITLVVTYAGSLAFSIWMGMPPGFLDVAAFAILLANIRGTMIAAKWKKADDPDLFPSRLHRTWTDKLVDQWPAKLWPVGKFMFSAVVLCYAGMMILGVVRISRRRTQILRTRNVPTYQIEQR